jgi:hypothetical protein
LNIVFFTNLHSMENVYNYWGIFENGTLVSNRRLEDLAQIPNIKYFVREESGKLTLINSDDSLNFLKNGDFELRDISRISKGKATATFYENRIDNIFQLELKISGLSFVLNELIPLMVTLNEFGSYNAYMNSK